MIYLHSNFSGGLRQTQRFGRLSSSNVIDFGVSQQRVCDFLLVGPVLRRCKDNAGFLHSTLFHFGGAPVGPEVLIVHVGVSPSMYLKLISREIIFEVFQPV